MRIICYRCDKIGHFVAQCLELKLKLQEAQENNNTETQEADELRGGPMLVKGVSGDTPFI